MRYLLITVTLLTGCSDKHKVEHELSCYVSMVIDDVSGKETPMPREIAIKNDFVYDFKVFDDGILVVNDTERYRETKESGSYHYYYSETNGNISDEMIYQFDEAYTEVLFRLKKKKMTYRYSCR